MACQPSSTFLLVASSTSKGGTIWPAGMASIFRPPAVSLSTRSAKILKCSCRVLLAGQVDCILIDLAAGACAPASRLNPAAKANATAKAIERLPMTASPVDWTADAKPGPFRVSMTDVGSRTRRIMVRRIPACTIQENSHGQRTATQQPRAEEAQAAEEAGRAGGAGESLALEEIAGRSPFFSCMLLVEQNAEMALLLGRWRLR